MKDFTYVPENEGFLRPDALLAVVVVTDEDDCSAPSDTELFDPSQHMLESPLGPITSYRCFEFGVLCQGVGPGRVPGPREDCVPGSFDPDPRHQLVPIEDFVTAFSHFKADPRRVFVGVFAGGPEPVEVYLDPTGNPLLKPYRSGTPGIRLFRFVSQFDADRARFWLVTAGYEGPYHPMMAEFAAMLSESLWP